MKKCQICIEIWVEIIVLFIAVLFFMYLFKNQERNTDQPIPTQMPTQMPTRMPRFPIWFEAKDVLRNPYEPPLSDDSLQPIRVQVPINISTNPGAVDTSYRQVGILTPHSASSSSCHEKNRIIPLMGRPLYVSRNKWQYYTMTDKTNSIKLPISYKGRSCTNEYGCDELLGGEHVYVEGYDEAFKVTKYDNDTIRYIPFI